ncbi:hypothetical protein ESA94_07630 [Lacibacter luteus]|uniref:Uncharacterized protein n=1 Tax=Lacibacter luteus TaxID=2508719 RepID=A0A4Q1CII4_9BACT|nr:hypothetical protein [Lacibacter luteus]RXK60343.1 hypothetical protein ESA94_07630 [Lacibacter luteus]
MNSIELYPELKEYIFNYCGKYFGEYEKKAHLHLHALAKSMDGANVKMYKFFMKEENVLDNPEIKDLVSGGYDAFKEKVVTRIWNEHKNELELNLCPRCRKIARTPEARQCRFCFHDWH